MDRVGVRQTRHVGVARCGSSSGLPCIPSLGPALKLNSPTLFSRLNPRRSPRARLVPASFAPRNGKNVYYARSTLEPHLPPSPLAAIRVAHYGMAMTDMSCLDSAPTLWRQMAAPLLTCVRVCVCVCVCVVCGCVVCVCVVCVCVCVCGVCNAAVSLRRVALRVAVVAYPQKSVKPEFLTHFKCYAVRYNITRFSHLRLPHLSPKSEAHVGQSSFDPAHFPTTSTCPITS